VRAAFISLEFAAVHQAHRRASAGETSVIDIVVAGRNVIASVSFRRVMPIGPWSMSGPPSAFPAHRGKAVELRINTLRGIAQYGANSDTVRT